MNDTFVDTNNPIFNLTLKAYSHKIATPKPFHHPISFFIPFHPPLPIQISNPLSHKPQIHLIHIPQLSPRTPNRYIPDTSQQVEIYGYIVPKICKLKINSVDHIAFNYSNFVDATTVAENSITWYSAPTTNLHAK